MTEPHRTFDQQQDVESHGPYLTVFLILLNYTLMEYIYATWYESSLLLPLLLFGAALAVTVITSVIAAVYRLHYNWRWIVLPLIPAILLSIIPLPLLLGLLILAIVKATLVAMYFMHLIFEGRWVYLMLVPAGFLAMVFVTALYPDIGMQAEAPPPPPGADELVSAPVEPGSAPAAVRL